MGATYGAVHVKSVELARVIDCVVAYAGRLLPDDAPESDLERRILVFEAGGWVTVADEELVTSEDAAEGLGRVLSGELATDAIAIVVFHSDTAILERFRHGDRAGRFQVPEDGTLDQATGHQQVAAAFLRDLATSPGAGAELAAGLLADHTFPEETTSHAAGLIGLPHPGAGARYLWNDPPTGSRKLRFAVPEPEPVEAWEEPEAARAVRVTAHQQIECCVGAPLAELVMIQVHAQRGPRIAGLGIQLGGDALARLDVPRLEGWNPESGETEIMTAAVEPSGLARFPRNSIAPATQPTFHGTSAAALRAWRAAMQAESSKGFYARLVGAPHTAGTATLVVRATDADGTPLDADPLRIELVIEPAPRLPLLPMIAARSDEQPHDVMRRIRAAQGYAGTTWLAGWLGFDATFADAGDLVLGGASELAAFIGEVDVHVTSAGTHPKAKPLRRGGSLAADRGVTQHLAKEADVMLQLPYDASDGSKIHIRHQPDGTTIFDRKTRESLAQRHPPARIVPVDLWFSIARPSDPTARRELGACLERLFVRALALASCVGGYVAPTGAVQHDDLTWYEHLAELHRGHDDVDVVRRRPRAPGWRVIVPHGALSALAVQPGVTRTEGAAGALLAVGGPDPFALADTEREAIERTLIDAFRQR